VRQPAIRALVVHIFDDGEVVAGRGVAGCVGVLGEIEPRDGVGIGLERNRHLARLGRGRADHGKGEGKGSRAEHVVNHLRKREYAVRAVAKLNRKLGEGSALDCARLAGGR
jgi:hypothetical protein